MSVFSFDSAPAFGGAGQKCERERAVKIGDDTKLRRLYLDNEKCRQLFSDIGEIGYYSFKYRFLFKRNNQPIIIRGNEVNL